ncbi:MAG: hypothetical protein HY421_01405 [Candidatus Kerfeldbacteria bacterium]|nr:hypothetical protein [Candidatus Kerfeldbacteria bacterium]
MMRRWLIIAVVLLAAGAAALLVSRTPRTTNQPTAGDQSVLNRSQTSPPDVPTNPAPDPTTDQLLATARLFAERYGTTSSEAPVAHLESVLSVCSSALAQTFQRQISQPPAPTATRITSRALTFAVRSQDERAGRADVMVTLRREEQAGTEPTKTYNQELNLQFVRQGDAWKVNAATWGKQL